MKTNPSVLIAFMPNISDWRIANKQNWYRIPVEKAPKIIRENRAEYLAFYFPSVFGEKMKWRVFYYAKIKSVTKTKRINLFPEEPKNRKSNTFYYKICFDKIEVLPSPFVSKRGHRVIFVSTSKEKFFSGSTDFNTLFQSSPLENKMGEIMDEMKVEYDKEWREYVAINKFYYLDFAVWCKKGSIDIECDGDTYHMENGKVHLDKTRNNELESYGWSVLRFTSKHFKMENDHIKKSIYQTVKELGGVLKVSSPHEPYLPKKPNDPQFGLFD